MASLRDLSKVASVRVDKFKLDQTKKGVLGQATRSHKKEQRGIHRAALGKIEQF